MLAMLAACSGELGGFQEPPHDASTHDSGVVPIDAGAHDAAHDSGTQDDADAGAPYDAGQDAALPPPPPPAFIEFFDDATFPTLEITLPAESRTALESEPRVYARAHLKYGALELADVGIRIKGRASFRALDDKPSFKIKDNECVPGTRFLGLKRLTLNNMVQDPSKLRECLAYKLFRAIGVAAPMCNHVRLYVDGKYEGLYSNVQSIDDVFVEWLFDPAPGNLFDTTNDEYFIDVQRESQPPAQETKFILETNKPPSGTPIPPELIADLSALIDAASLSSDESFLATLEQHVDLDQLLTVGAAQAVLADWDGYFGATNNYLIYHELERDRFIWLPWGLDQVMGLYEENFVGADYAIDHSGSNRPNGLLHQRCQANPTCAARYTAEVQEAVTAFEALDLVSSLDALYAKIEAAALEDTKIEDDSFMNAVEDLRAFIQDRPAAVRAELP